jgi:hypothetical protein
MSCRARQFPKRASIRIRGWGRKGWKAPLFDLHPIHPSFHPSRRERRSRTATPDQCDHQSIPTPNERNERHTHTHTHGAAWGTDGGGVSLHAAGTPICCAVPAQVSTPLWVFSQGEGGRGPEGQNVRLVRPGPGPSAADTTPWINSKAWSSG